MIARIETILRDGPPLRLAFVFGSAARETMHATSDVDVGILPVDLGLPLRAELELQGRLEGACERPVDLVRLDHASTLLKWNIIRTGIPVAARSRPDVVRFVAASAAEYADIAPAVHRAEETFRRRLAAGTTRTLRPMTDRSIVLQKLATLREHVRRVRDRRPVTADALRDDLDRQDAIALSLLVAIQEAADVAFHVTSDEGWGIPASYGEAFQILARHGVIDIALAGETTAAAGLRNRIAHGYASVDVDRLWGEIPTGLAALERFSTALARFVGSAES